MPIRFPCTACGQLLGIATRKVGTEIHCPTCGLAVIVPDEEQAQLMRQRSRGEKAQPFSTPDTPPEIAIPRERHEAFDRGLESFLTQLDVSPATKKPIVANTIPNVKAPLPKPTPPKTPAASLSPNSATKARTSNGSNSAPAASALPSGSHTAKPAAPPAIAPKIQPPLKASAMEIPLAFEEHEVSVLSADDLLELADEPPLQPVTPPSAKLPASPKEHSTVGKSKVAALSNPAAASPKPPALPVAKVSTATPVGAPANAPVSDFALLVESPRPVATDYGFDFSIPVSTPITTRKAEPAPPAAAAPSPSPSVIPTAPFDNAVWISRRAIYTHIAILVLVSIATFLLGWICGGAGTRAP